MKNKFLKKVKIEYAYATLECAGWTWKVLKLYKNPENSIKDRYSSAFCAVKSPYTNNSWDYGNVYVHDIPGLTGLLKVEVLSEGRTVNKDSL